MHLANLCAAVSHHFTYCCKDSTNVFTNSFTACPPTALPILPYILYLIFSTLYILPYILVTKHVGEESVVFQKHITVLLRNLSHIERI